MYKHKAIWHLICLPQRLFQSTWITFLPNNQHKPITFMHPLCIKFAFWTRILYVGVSGFSNDCAMDEPLASWMIFFTFWKVICKCQLVCKLIIMENNFHFCLHIYFNYISKCNKKSFICRMFTSQRLSSIKYFVPWYYFYILSNSTTFHTSEVCQTNMAMPLLTV